MFKQLGPAPVPADDLAAALAPFGQSRMLPRAAYVDPAVFEWEQANIFSGWICVGHASELAGVGAQRAVGSGANAVLLVRGDDDEHPRLREHLQAPRSRTAARAAQLPSAATSSAPTTRGPTASTVGVRNAPGFSDVDGFAPEEFGLAPLRLANWHGWLFVDPSGTDVEFSAHVAGMEDVIAPYHPEDLTIVARHSYELATNWKVIAENYQECYHCSTHPPRTVADQPTDQRREPPPRRDRGWAAGCR